MCSGISQESKLLEETRGIDILVVMGFIYSLKVVFLPLDTARIVILCLLFSIVLLRKEKLVFPYHAGTFRSLLPLFFFLCYAAIGVVLTGAANISIFASYALLLFQVGLGAYLLAMFFFRGDFNLDRLLFLFLLIFAIQGFFVLLNFLVVPYREFYNSIVPLEGNIKVNMVESLFRVRGLTQGIGASYSAHYAFGFFIAAYFSAAVKLSRKDRIAIYCCLPMILVAILFTGRTGLVMIPYAACFYYLLLLVNGTFRLSKLLPILLLPFIAVGLYFIMKWIYLLVTDGGIILPGGGDVLARWESWAFGQFIDFFEGSEDNIRTLEILRQHLFLPEKDRVLLWGDPNSWGNIRSDIGYVRILFVSGIIGLLIHYIGFICLHIQMAILSATRSQRIFFIAYLVWMLIIEYKEPFLLIYLFTSLAMLMLFVNMRFGQLQTGWGA